MHARNLFELHTLAVTLEAKDAYTQGRSRRVSNFAKSIAREMGCPEDFQQQIGIAELLHDIGKVGVSETVLNEPGQHVRRSSLDRVTIKQWSSI